MTKDPELVAKAGECGLDDNTAESEIAAEGAKLGIAANVDAGETMPVTTTTVASAFDKDLWSGTTISGMTFLETG